MNDTMIPDSIYQGDCAYLMSRVEPESVALAVVDPPYNIGYDYGEGEYKDNLKPAEYHAWSRVWLNATHRVLRPDGSLWVVIGDEWAAEIKVLACEIGFHLRSWVIWYYTFGVNSSGKFSRSHAHLLYFTKNKQHFTFNAQQCRVPSSRALVYNDKRANPDGRLPDDTWILRPQDLPDGFPAEGDTWHVPRVCGTFKERQEGAANQMPEQLVGRIIRTCSHEREIVLDPMCGTGTVPAVAKKLNRVYLGFDLSVEYSQLAARRVASVNAGDALDGPIPQGG
jgi:DNA modification methylase